MATAEGAWPEAAYEDAARKERNRGFFWQLLRYGPALKEEVEHRRLPVVAAAIVDAVRPPNVVQHTLGRGAYRRCCTAPRLDRVFVDAGFEWREAGCSMCLGMNPDILQPGERCASTSNRNFEGRQGKGGRTHLVSPPMAAAAAVAGHFVDVRDWS